MFLIGNGQQSMSVTNVKLKNKKKEIRISAIPLLHPFHTQLHPIHTQLHPIAFALHAMNSPNQDWKQISNFAR
jgi:hypothetical protein